MDALAALIKRAEAAVAVASDLAALDEVRVEFLGKKGELTALLKALGALPAADRPLAGQAINQAKESLQAAIDLRRAAFEQAALEAALASERIDS